MLKKLGALLLIGIGVFFLVQAVMPILIFRAWERDTLDKNSLLISPGKIGEVLGVSVQQVGNFPAFVSEKLVNSAPYQEYKITIPSIRIKNLSVKVWNNDFEQTPGQLPGTALPGERGNVFITGHSSIPQFQLGKTKAVFSRLSNIRKNDSIIVNANGQEFHYSVEGLRVVDPKEVGVINPPDSSGRYLSLMTCVPPGLNTKRLIVLAKIKE